MSLLDLLKTRLHEQREAAAIGYWQLLDEQPTKGRKNGDGVAAFEVTLAKTGKTLADAETDGKLLADLAALGDLDERQRVADAEVAKLKASAVAATAEADELLRKVEQLRKQADADRRRIRSLGERTAAARGERGRLLLLLARRGHSPSATEVERGSIAGRLREVRRELAESREHLADVERVAKGRSSNEAASLPLTKARRQVAEGESRERDLVASLAELGGGQ